MTAKKKGGGKLSRSEIVTIRLDPRLRFAAELAARKQRRSLSSFVEWAIEEAINRVEIANQDGQQTNVNDVMKVAWDVEEADRLAKLALYFPDLLTFEEERLWKMVIENPYFWKQVKAVIDDDIPPPEALLHFGRLRDQWPTLNKIVLGEANITDIPQE